MKIGEWGLVILMLFIGVALIIRGRQWKNVAGSFRERSVGNEMIYGGIASLILVCSVVMLTYIIPQFLAPQDNVYWRNEGDKTQKVQTKVEDVTSQPVVTAENIAYTNGEVAGKLGNLVILVSVHGKTYKILVEQEVYDSLKTGDAIGCIAYLDENNKIIGVNYVN